MIANELQNVETELSQLENIIVLTMKKRTFFIVQKTQMNQKKIKIHKLNV